MRVPGRLHLGLIRGVARIVALADERQRIGKADTARHFVAADRNLQVLLRPVLVECFVDDNVRGGRTQQGTEGRTLQAKGQAQSIPIAEPRRTARLQPEGRGRHGLRRRRQRVYEL